MVCNNRLVEPPGQDFMQMQVLAGEPNACTQVHCVRRLGALPAGWPVAQAGDARAGMALYRLLPETGRKHQLRMHMLGLGLPIFGDRIYPQLWPEPALDAAPDWQHPLQLLAREIAFTDPCTGAPRRFTSRRHLALVGDPPPAPPA
jgi:tRNA pseudouridine32 synthase / 23S rRNA pseudouridine746 synthase